MTAAKPKSQAVISVWLFWREETDKAVLFTRGESRKHPFWLPKSRIKFTVQPDGLARVEMPEWLAKQELLI